MRQLKITYKIRSLFLRKTSLLLLASTLISPLNSSAGIEGVADCTNFLKTFTSLEEAIAYNISKEFKPKSEAQIKEWYDKQKQKALNAFAKSKYSRHDLTDDEITAIYFYTSGSKMGESYPGSLFFKVTPPEDPDYTPRGIPILVDILKQALNKLPDYHGVVHRFVSLNESLIKKYPLGEIVEADEFWSGSVIDSHFEAHHGQAMRNTILIIRSIRGKDISGYSMWPQESEVIFPIHSKFRVSRRLKDGNKLKIFLEQIF